METLEQKIRSNSIVKGLILGAIGLVLGIFSYYAIVSLVSSIWGIGLVGLCFSIIIPIVLAIIFSLDLRKKIGGFWSMRQATTGIFIMFLAASVVQFAGSEVEKILIPNMAQRIKEATISATTAMMEKSGRDQASIDAKVAELNTQMDIQSTVTIGKKLLGICISIVFIFVIALIFGAIFKKDPPIYGGPVDELAST